MNPTPRGEALEGARVVLGRLSEARRTGRWYPEMESDLRLAMALADAHDAVRGTASEERRLKAAEQAGYARAVAVLRDDDRYQLWWTARPTLPADRYWTPEAREHLADYLETVADLGGAP